MRIFNKSVTYRIYTDTQEDHTERMEVYKFGRTLKEEGHGERPLRVLDIRK